MRIGLMIEGQEGLDWDDWTRLLRAAEEMDFHSVWRSDHFFSLSGDTTQASLETWVSLTFAARETKRVRLGTLACPMTFRHPSLLARMAAQVDALSGGRLELGIGAGWNAVEHKAFGVPFPPTKTRMDMLEEGIQVIRALLRDSPANFKGEIYQIEDAECYPRPVQSPLPIAVGGSGERRTLKIAARYADHWNAVGVGLAGYPHKREVLERHCADAGRDATEIRRSLMCGFILGRDEAGIEEHFRRVARIISLEQAPSDSSMQQLRDARGWLVGTPSEVVEQIKEWEALGVEEVMLQHLDHKDMGTLELIAKEIIPNVA